MFRQPPPGPTTPPLFVGHLGDRSEDIKLSGDDDSVYEIVLGGACMLDGIHIVPNKINLNPVINLEGKTMPDMSTRAFHVQLYGRNSESGALVQIYDLRVEGGVQWVPVPFPQLAGPVDYLAITGDFLTLSIIIHGQRIEIKKLSVTVMKHIENGPPNYETVKADELFDVVAHDTGPAANITVAIGGKKETPSHIEKIAQTSTSAVLSSLKCLDECSIRHDLYTVRSDSKSIYHHSARVSIESVAALVEKIFSVDPDGLSTMSTVNLTDSFSAISRAVSSCWESASMESKTKSSHEDITIALGDEAAYSLCSILQKGCEWLSAELAVEHFVAPNSNSMNSETALEAATEFIQLGHAILDCCSLALMNAFTARVFADAGCLTLLGALVQQYPPLPPSLLAHLLLCLRVAVTHVDLCVPMIEPSEPYVDEDGNEVMRTTFYQTILMLVGNAKQLSIVTPPARSVLNWCAFADSLISLRRFSEVVEQELKSVAEAASRRMSSYQKTFSGGGGGLGTSGVEGLDTGDDDDNDEAGGRLHAAADTMVRIVHALESQVHMLDRAIDAVLADRMLSQTTVILSDLLSTHTDAGRMKTATEAGGEYSNAYAPGFTCQYKEELDIWEGSITALLEEAKIASVFVVMASTSMIAAELAAVMDWAAPAEASLVATARRSRRLLVEALGRVISLPGIELTFAKQSKAVALLWRMVSCEDQPLSCQPLSELLGRSYSAPSSRWLANDIAAESSPRLEQQITPGVRFKASVNQLDSYSNSSVGWNLWLSACAVGFTNSLLQVSEALSGIVVLGTAADADMETEGDLSADQLSKGVILSNSNSSAITPDSEEALIRASSHATPALAALLTISSFPAGAEVVRRIFSQQGLLWDLIVISLSKVPQTIWIDALKSPEDARIASAAESLQASFSVADGLDHGEEKLKDSSDETMSDERESINIVGEGDGDGDCQGMPVSEGAYSPSQADDDGGDVEGSEQKERTEPQAAQLAASFADKSAKTTTMSSTTTASKKLVDSVAQKFGRTNCLLHLNRHFGSLADSALLIACNMVLSADDEATQAAVAKLSPELASALEVMLMSSDASYTPEAAAKARMAAEALKTIGSGGNSGGQIKDEESKPNTNTPSTMLLLEARRNAAKRCMKTLQDLSKSVVATTAKAILQATSTTVSGTGSVGLARWPQFESMPPSVSGSLHQLLILVNERVLVEDADDDSGKEGKRAAFTEVMDSIAIGRSMTIALDLLKVFVAQLRALSLTWSTASSSAIRDNWHKAHPELLRDILLEPMRCMLPPAVLESILTATSVAAAVAAVAQLPPAPLPPSQPGSSTATVIPPPPPPPPRRATATATTRTTTTTQNGVAHSGDSKDSSKQSSNVEADAFISNLSGVLEAVHLILSFLARCSTKLQSSGSKISVKSKDLFESVTAAAAFSSALVSEELVGSPSSCSRRIQLECVEILSLYCPNSSWCELYSAPASSPAPLATASTKLPGGPAGGAVKRPAIIPAVRSRFLDCGLVEYLVRSAIESPHLLQSNMKLLLLLLPSGKSGCSQAADLARAALKPSDSDDGGVSDGGRITKGSVALVTTAPALPPSLDEDDDLEEGDFGTLRPRELKRDILECRLWEALLLRQSPDKPIGSTQKSKENENDSVNDSTDNHATVLAAAWSEQADDQLDEADLDPMFNILSREKFDICSLVSVALVSASPVIQRQGQLLIAALLALGHRTAGRVAKAVVRTLRRFVLCALQLETEEEEEQAGGDELMVDAATAVDKKDVAVLRQEHRAALVRMLMSVTVLCGTDVGCMALVCEGVLHPLLSSVEAAEPQIIAMGLESIETVLRSLHRVHTRMQNMPGIPSSQEMRRLELVFDEKTGKLSDPVRRALEISFVRGRVEKLAARVVDKLAIILPDALFRVQESIDCIYVWMHGASLLPLMTWIDTKKFLKKLNARVTIQVLCVKLWIEFEDAFQLLLEITEVRKGLVASAKNFEKIHGTGTGSGSGDNISALQPQLPTVQDCDGVIHDAHSQLALTAHALRCVIDTVLLATLRGRLPLPTMRQCVRYPDPKKVASKFQRSYTMWAVQYLNRLQGGSPRGRGKDSAGSPGAGQDGSPRNGSSGSQRVQLKVLPSIASEDAGIAAGGSVAMRGVHVSDDDSFEARHAIITSSLRVLVATMADAARIGTGRGGAVVAEEDLSDEEDDDDGDGSDTFVSFHTPFAAAISADSEDGDDAEAGATAASDRACHEISPLEDDEGEQISERVLLQRNKLSYRLLEHLYTTTTYEERLLPASVAGQHACHKLAQGSGLFGKGFFDKLATVEHNKRRAQQQQDIRHQKLLGLPVTNRTVIPDRLGPVFDRGHFERLWTVDEKVVRAGVQKGCYAKPESVAESAKGPRESEVQALAQYQLQPRDGNPLMPFPPLGPTGPPGQPGHFGLPGPPGPRGPPGATFAGPAHMLPILPGVGSPPPAAYVGGGGEGGGPVLVNGAPLPKPPPQAPAQGQQPLPLQSHSHHPQQQPQPAGQQQQQQQQQQHQHPSRLPPPPPPMPPHMQHLHQPPGAQGQPGSQGFQGPPGVHGQPGRPGFQGPPGAQGFQGPPGAEAQSGPPGSRHHAPGGDMLGGASLVAIPPPMPPFRQGAPSQTAETHHQQHGQQHARQHPQHPQREWPGQGQGQGQPGSGPGSNIPSSPPPRAGPPPGQAPIEPYPLHLEQQQQCHHQHDEQQQQQQQHPIHHHEQDQHHPLGGPDMRGRHADFQSQQSLPDERDWGRGGGGPGGWEGRDRDGRGGDAGRGRDGRGRGGRWGGDWGPGRGGAGRGWEGDRNRDGLGAPGGGGGRGRGRGVGHDFDRSPVKGLHHGGRWGQGQDGGSRGVGQDLGQDNRQVGHGHGSGQEHWHSQGQGQWQGQEPGPGHGPGIGPGQAEGNGNRQGSNGDSNSMNDSYNRGDQEQRGYRDKRDHLGHSSADRQDESGESGQRPKRSRFSPRP